MFWCLAKRKNAQPIPLMTEATMMGFFLPILSDQTAPRVMAPYEITDEAEVRSPMKTGEAPITS